MPKTIVCKNEFRIKPTFKPRLADNIEIKLFKEDERGKFYIVKSAEDSEFLKVHEQVREVLEEFNGSNTIVDIEQQLGEKDINLDLTHLVGILARRGFLKNLRPSETKRKHEPLSLKIRFAKLNARSMDRLCRLFSFVGNPFFRVFYLFFFIIGFVLFLYNFNGIYSAAIDLWKPGTPIAPLLFSIPIFYLVEFAHELAHAGAYHHYGGKSAEIGFEFNFMIPFFYTGTPDTYLMNVREKVVVFIAGPLVSLFFAEAFTYLYFFGGGRWQSTWAINALLWHLSTLVTMTPIIRTDGYFIVQSTLKFPNLLRHGLSNLNKILHLAFRRISMKEYRDYLSEYSASERKVLLAYSLMLPIGTFVLVYVFVVLALQMQIVDIILMTPQVISGVTLSAKIYILWALYITNTVLLVAGVIGTVIRAIK